MTATQVNGLQVIADEPTQSPMNNPAGKPVLWEQTRTLLLDDGSIVYGCKHCDLTDPNMWKIRPHLKEHAPTAPDNGRPVRKPPAKKAANSELTLTDLLAKVEQLHKVEADRDQWRSRALRAERSLATMRRALNGK